MINTLFSGDSREGSFFRRIDWTAFWTATFISFLVYLVTLGPSVTLEDSGELAVAGRGDLRTIRRGRSRASFGHRGSGVGYDHHHKSLTAAFRIA